MNAHHPDFTLASSSGTYYLNADFDLSLRPRAEQVRNARIERQVRELSSQALLGAGEDDVALVLAEIPDDYLEYLDACGLGVPRIRIHPDIDPTLPLHPFGWNDDTITLNRKTEHPALVQLGVYL